MGIGTTNPTSALEVTGAVKADNFIGAGTGLTGLSGENIANGFEMIVWGGYDGSMWLNDTWSYTPGKVMLLYPKP